MLSNTRPSGPGQDVVGETVVQSYEHGDAAIERDPKDLSSPGLALEPPVAHEDGALMIDGYPLEHISDGGELNHALDLARRQRAARDVTGRVGDGLRESLAQAVRVAARAHHTRAKQRIRPPEG